MKTLVNSLLLPDVWCQSEIGFIPNDRELSRLDVFVADGDVYIGQVSYIKRARATGAEYGWLPTKKLGTTTRLTSKVDAIKRLPRWEDK